VIVSCAVAIASGTALGGWRIIRTLGRGGHGRGHRAGPRPRRARRLRPGFPQVRSRGVVNRQLRSNTGCSPW
jgi:hypothetical protein